ncbi:hypothetical protein AX16_002378 [Volvariella volvacea WC 439]|nr:hypothetical protein AX16_002378 [Volvariella volvacea WC 439]
MSNRPPLPVRHANPHVKTVLDSGSLPPVKYQILNCQGQDILVGRLKIETPTPSGHAFILRRFDTGAVSLTTMFRAAFPNAAESDEKQEVQWVKENYDLSGNNGSTKDTSITRLAGTWVNPQLALELGDSYLLGALIQAIVDAKPDPNANYRRSGRQSTAPTNPITGTPKPQSAILPMPPSSPLATPLKSLQVPLLTPRPSSPGLGQPHPAKRRKDAEASPAPLPLPPQTVPNTPAGAPQSSPVKPTTMPRRSARTKSPAPPKILSFTPTSASTPAAKTTRTTKALFRREETTRTPGGSDETVVDEEVERVKVVDGIAGSELREEDLREQKQLIENLKAQREAVQKEKEEKEVEETEEAKEEEEHDYAEEEQQVEEEQSRKRAREDEDAPLKFEFKEPETGVRPIATNRRVGRFHLEPKNKSFAWGVAAFALGVGAVTWLPNFF